jgi:UDP-N-acetylglucosamine:LPS N-acetylglucosamine transferase
MEAVELIEHKGAFTIQNAEELNTLLDTMLADKEKRQEWGDNARNYVTSNAGATDKILSMVEFKETSKNK